MAAELAPDRTLMNAEYEAWQNVVAEWKAAFPATDFNDHQFHPLVRAIELWGERLVNLRASQEPETSTVALRDKERAYDEVRTPRPAVLENPPFG